MGAKLAYAAILIGVFLLGISSSMAFMTMSKVPVISAPALNMNLSVEDLPSLKQSNKHEMPQYESLKPEPSYYTKDRPSPKNRISEKDIRVYTDRVVINVDNPRWAKFTPTHSMDPVFDTEAHALQVVPKSEKDLQIGDIISYESSSGTIIHRIVAIGMDSQGWYAFARGDNNPVNDPGKVRFNQVKKVVIGIIY